MDDAQRRVSAAEGREAESGLPESSGTGSAGSELIMLRLSPKQIMSKSKMVPGAGIEPAWCRHRGIFIPKLQLSLLRSLKTHLWSGLSLYRIIEDIHDLGRSRQVSTLSLVD